MLLDAIAALRAQPCRLLECGYAPPVQLEPAFRCDEQPDAAKSNDRAQKKPLRGQPDAQVSVDRRDVHLLGNGPPIVVRIANARGQDHSIALNLLIWKLRQ